MHTRRFSVPHLSAYAILGATLLLMSTHAAGQTTLFSFDGPDGSTPYAGLVFDSSGNLFGTASTGGAVKMGVLYELVPQGGGGWTEEVHHYFGKVSGDGTTPYGTLLIDASNNLYGTTYSGGAYGGGTVFEVTPGAGPNWPETILYNFGNGTDGANPHGALIFDALGNLYGTTSTGGANGAGTVFELTPIGGGAWSEAILYSFIGGTGGSDPNGSVIFDSSGNIYGTTVSGGSYGGGAAFELIKSEGYRFKILHNFGGFSDGANPHGGLVLDAFGNLYGTTTNGGGHNNPVHFGGGIVFELSPGGGEAWNETVLYEFCNHSICTDINPYDTPLMDASGNLYGTNFGRSGYSTVWELTPTATPPWTETLLVTFSYNRAYAGLIFDASGNLYGTTSTGGGNGFGIVFEITH
ncbi:MAG TPA: choice-of-anchor tandem repeat GloVer-containing protein [Candidatus Acidoferrum sp.]|jgi:uncharacterized repeat protein (TIGR03803 family)|nr:choice-of-anchor tandem repeat GloVer-containing protein [Candidatus Acidoferrum sp.]